MAKESKKQAKSYMFEGGYTPRVQDAKPIGSGVSYWQGRFSRPIPDEDLQWEFQVDDGSGGIFRVSYDGRIPLKLMQGLAASFAAVGPKAVSDEIEKRLEYLTLKAMEFVKASFSEAFRDAAAEVLEDAFGFIATEAGGSPSDENEKLFNKSRYVKNRRKRSRDIGGVGRPPDVSKRAMRRALLEGAIKQEGKGSITKAEVFRKLELRGEADFTSDPFGCLRELLAYYKFSSWEDFVKEALLPTGKN